MSSLDKNNAELLNSNSHNLFNDSDSDIDNDDNFVLEVEDSPYNEKYTDEILAKEIQQCEEQDKHPFIIDYNINPFNEDRPSNQTDSDQQTDTLKNDTTKGTEKEQEFSTNLQFYPKSIPRVTSHPLHSPPNLNSYNNYPKNCFTKDGRSGWICFYCKNFNYEIRIQCNRCNRSQNMNENNSVNNNMNTIISNIPFMNNMSPIANYSNVNANNGYGFNYTNQSSPKIDPIKYSHSYSPKVKKNEEKKSKPFLEREGDWRCFQCNNLNFAFRLNCNRCHLTKIDNQKLIQQYMNSYLNVQLVNKLELDGV